MAKTSDFIAHLRNPFIAQCIWDRLCRAMTQLRCQEILSFTQQCAVLTLARNEGHIPRAEGGA
ncbi:hypothetical protein KUA08_17610, partial [Komagataeibacter melomenusus]|uniref:hypothetical protein n=1 Tax=Komagataeibacter melomenusus TaxID=2766578 RepID=UPI001C2D78D3